MWKNGARRYQRPAAQPEAPRHKETMELCKMIYPLFIYKGYTFTQSEHSECPVCGKAHFIDDDCQSEPREVVSRG